MGEGAFQEEWEWKGVNGTGAGRMVRCGRGRAAEKAGWAMGPTENTAEMDGGMTGGAGVGEGRRVMGCPRRSGDK